MIEHAQAERRALADTLAQTDPNADTLCDGWRATDLVCHLIVREGDPFAAAGILLRPLAGRTTDVMDRLRHEFSYAELVDRFRTGPPRWSPAHIGRVDTAANTMEFFIHHEDVRRAQPSWEPRPISEALQEFLWRRLRTAGRLLLRQTAVGILLARPDGAVTRVRSGEPTAVLAGRPSEITLYATGRRQVANVELSGPDAAVEALRQAPLGM